MLVAAECRKNAGILSWSTALFTFEEYNDVYYFIPPWWA